MLDGYTHEPGNYTYIPEIRERIQQLIDIMLTQHCKVLFVRFDARFPQGTIPRGKNEEISCLMKTLMSYYYDQGVAAQYIWVREQLNSDSPHYHVIVLLNGSLVQYPMGIWAKAAEIWSGITNGSSALIQQCWAQPIGRDCTGGIMIRRPSGVALEQERLEQQEAFQATYGAALEWGSYLAKEFSKDNTPSGVRRFGSSQL